MRARPGLQAAAVVAIAGAGALMAVWHRHAARSPAAWPADGATAAARARLAGARDASARCLAALPRIAPDALWALGEARPFAPAALDPPWHAHRSAVDPGSLLRRLLDPTAPRVTPNPRAGTEPGDPAALLLAYLHDALSCTGVAPSPRLATFLHEDHDGYVLTHQYLAIAWARRSECRVPPGWDERQRALVDEVLRELAAGAPFDDLFAERLFVVAHAGEARRLQPAWVATLLAHQGDDGCWRDPAPIEARLGDASFTASAAIDHTTALGLYTVARLHHEAR